jgi:hypothetical protein
LLYQLQLLSLPQIQLSTTKNLKINHMKKQLTNATAIRSNYLLLALAMLLSNSQLFAQTYVTEGFNYNIPYNVATPNLRVTTTDWLLGRFIGPSTPPNDFQWVNASNYPTASNEARTGFAGAGWVRYINRNMLILLVRLMLIIRPQAMQRS